MRPIRKLSAPILNSFSAALELAWPTALLMISFMIFISQVGCSAPQSRLW